MIHEARVNFELRISDCGLRILSRPALCLDLTCSLQPGSMHIWATRNPQSANPKFPAALIGNGKDGAVIKPCEIVMPNRGCPRRDTPTIRPRGVNHAHSNLAGSYSAAELCLSGAPTSSGRLALQ